MGLDLFSETTMNFEFSSGSKTPQDVASRIGVTSEAETQKVMNFSSQGSPSQSDIESDVPSESESTSQSSAPVVAPVQIVEVQTPQVSVSSAASLFEGDVGAGLEAELDNSRIEENLAVSESDKTAAQSGAGVPNPNISPTEGDSEFDVASLIVTGELFGVVGQATTQLNSGETQILGNAAAAPADEDSSYTAQSARERIDGTAGDDIIQADRNDIMPSGKSVRSVRLDAQFDSVIYEAKSVKITGLPEGFSIVDGTPQDNGFFVAVDPENPTQTQFILQYVMPQDTDPQTENGFYSDFTMNIEYDLSSKTGGRDSRATGTLQFGIRDVESEYGTQSTRMSLRTRLYYGA